MAAAWSLAAAGAWAGTAHAAGVPKPQNVVTPDQALKLLTQGNERYVSGVMRRHDFAHERAALASGQNPYAAILGCADSRIAPEYVFDSARGDLFVARVAGNFINDDMLGSLEYAVAVLSAPLILVLGHEQCGAVSAAIKAVTESTRYPGMIQSLVTAVAPAVNKALRQSPQDLLQAAIRQNVRDVVADLPLRSTIIQEAVQVGRVRIVGGVYQLKTGRVDFRV